jgi:TPR repeat protein
MRNTAPSTTTTPAQYEYDVFITHNWGNDERGRNNHERAVQIANALKSQRIRVWVGNHPFCSHILRCVTSTHWFPLQIDEEQMTGDMDRQMIKGIKGSAIVIMLVTKRYEDKIGVDGDDRDNCRKEFNFAVRTKSPKFMIPVVMEEGMRDALGWDGSLQMYFGGVLYVRMWDDDVNSNIPSLVKEIQVRLTDLSVVVEIQSTTTRSTVDANLGFSLLLEGDRALLRNEKSVNYARAIECFQQALSVGNATAAVFLAIMHHNGIGCNVDTSRSRDLCKQAVRMGVVQLSSNPNLPEIALTQFAVGWMYMKGLGVEKDENEAVKCYRLAADQGHINAQFFLGICFQNDIGVEKDEKEAVKYFRLAADQGHTRAQFVLGLFLENGIGVEKDEKEAVKYYRLAADQGHARAQVGLGFCFQNGIGVEKDENEAVKFFRLAADQSQTDAQFYLGICLHSGIGVEKNENEAVKYFRLAADQGQTDAQFYLGICLHGGTGVVKDEHGAVKYYRMAAEQGHTRAQFVLGICFANGTGVLKDESEAVKYYRLAADQGDTCAQFRLGVCFHSGIGVVKNEKEAMKYFRLAANGGHTSAQFNLGVWVSNGTGSVKNKNKAVNYFRLAADQGHTDAQINLGACFSNGTGVVVNSRTTAAKFFRLAADKLRHESRSNKSRKMLRRNVTECE